MPKGKIKAGKGYKTFQQLAIMLEISTETLRKKIIPLRPFLGVIPGMRKKLYTPEEVKFVLQNLR